MEKVTSEQNPKDEEAVAGRKVGRKGQNTMQDL